MTEREIKQLIKLLEKFKHAKEKSSQRVSDESELVDRDGRINSIIGTVTQWVKWHGRDELDMDL